MSKAFARLVVFATGIILVSIAHGFSLAGLLRPNW